MATQLQITSGPLASSKIANDDVKAQSVLANYAYSYGAEDTWTNQQKLDLVVLKLIEHMIERARRHSVAVAEKAAIDSAQTGVDF